MNKLLASVLATLLLTLGAACSSTKFTGLGLELTHLERATDGTVNATVRVTNTNVVAFNFSESHHTIILDGREIGTMKVTSATGIPSQTTVEQTGRLELKRGVDLPSGPASYRLESRIVVRLYGDRTENEKLGGSGTVVVK